MSIALGVDFATVSFYVLKNECQDLIAYNKSTFEIDIINFIELPTIGSVCNKTELVGQINYNDDENIDIYSIFSGKIVDVNDSLIDNSEQLFSNDMENSWLYRIYVNTRSEIDEESMTKEEYEEYLDELK